MNFPPLEKLNLFNKNLILIHYPKFVMELYPKVMSLNSIYHTLADVETKAEKKNRQICAGVWKQNDSSWQTSTMF
jgi:hypothetical protein